MGSFIDISEEHGTTAWYATDWSNNSLETIFNLPGGFSNREVDDQYCMMKQSLLRTPGYNPETASRLQMLWEIAMDPKAREIYNIAQSERSRGHLKSRWTVGYSKAAKHIMDKTDAGEETEIRYQKLDRKEQENSARDEETLESIAAGSFSTKSKSNDTKNKRNLHTLDIRNANGSGVTSAVAGSLRIQVEGLEAMVKNLQIEKGKKEEEVTGMKNVVAKLDKAIQGYTMQLKVKNSALNEKKEEFENLTSHNMKLRDSLSKLTEEKGVLEKQTHSIRQSNDDMRLGINRMESQHNQLKAKQSETLASISDTEEKNLNLNSQLTRLNSDVADKLERTENLECTRKVLDAKFSQLRLELDGNETRISEYERKNLYSAQLLQTLEQELSNSLNSISNLKKTQADSLLSISELEEYITKLNLSQLDYERQISAQEQRNNTLEKELAEEVAKLSSLDSRKTDCAESLSRVNAEVAATLLSISVSKDKNMKLQQDQAHFWATEKKTVASIKAAEVAYANQLSRLEQLTSDVAEKWSRSENLASRSRELDADLEQLLLNNAEKEALLSRLKHEKAESAHVLEILNLEASNTSQIISDFEQKKREEATLLKKHEDELGDVMSTISKLEKQKSEAQLTVSQLQEEVANLKHLELEEQQNHFVQQAKNKTQNDQLKEQQAKWSAMETMKKEFSEELGANVEVTATVDSVSPAQEARKFQGLLVSKKQFESPIKPQKAKHVATSNCPGGASEVVFIGTRARMQKLYQNELNNSEKPTDSDVTSKHAENPNRKGSRKKPLKILGQRKFGVPVKTSPSSLIWRCTYKGSNQNSECGRTFAHQASLSRHKRIHKPAIGRCVKCGTEFFRTDHQRAHMKIHS